MNFGILLKKIRLKNGDSLRSLAEKIGLHFTFIDKVEKGTAPASKTFIEKIINVYPEEKVNLTKEYLKEILPQTLQTEDPLKIVNNENILNLPVYGKVSAGRGYMNFDVPSHFMPIAKGNFSKRSFFVEINGDSMSPTLENGEFALVDPENTEYIKNKIYVVTYNDENYIKRIEFKEKLGIISLKSDNPEYDDIDISRDMQEYFKINGRVVEVISKKKI